MLPVYILKLQTDMLPTGVLSSALWNTLQGLHYRGSEAGLLAELYACCCDVLQLAAPNYKMMQGLLTMSATLLSVPLRVRHGLLCLPFAYLSNK